MKTKQKREIIKFGSNEQVELTLDTDPSSAKSSTRDSQWGPKTSYTYFTKEDKVFFASQTLHDKLANYAKGDKLKITLVDGKMWSITSDGAGARKESENNKNLEVTETSILLRKIAMDIDLIKNHLFGTKNEETKKYPKDEEDEEDLDF